MSEITERTPQAVSPAGGPGGRAPAPLRTALGVLTRQREATVFVVAVVLLLGLLFISADGSNPLQAQQAPLVRAAQN